MNNKIAIDIHERTGFADGHAFAEAGTYERLVGRARFAVDPDAPAQAGIVDVDKASRNRDGLVEFAADLCILKPVDPARANRRLFFDYGNRGNKRAVQYFNDAPACNEPATREHAGNGYLFRRGYTVVWGAWQGDLLPGDGRMTLALPVATDGAAPLIGPGAVRVHRRSGRPDHAAVERLGLHPQPPHGLTRFLEGPADTAPLPRRRARRDCTGRVAVRAPRDRHGPRFPRLRAGDYRVRHPHPYAGRIRARLDL